jgi:hypothetical protein
MITTVQLTMHSHTHAYGHETWLATPKRLGTLLIFHFSYIQLIKLASLPISLRGGSLLADQFFNLKSGETLKEFTPRE